jgi:dinuclear metal center YbgI/SA1388 family protein
MLIGELLRALSFDQAAEWDPVGLQIGDPTLEAQTVGVCHEVTDRVVDQSEDLDLLITYHPLLFEKVNRLLAGSDAGGRAHRLIRGGVSLAVVHTAWDAAPGGTADALANALGLTDVSSFGLIEPALRKRLVAFVPPEAVDSVSKALFAIGAGTIGRYRGCSFRSAGLGTFLPGDGSSPVVGRIGRHEQVDEVRLEMLLQPGGAAAAVAALLAAHPYEEPAFDLIDSASNAGLIGRVGTYPGDLDDLIEHIRRGLGNGIRVAGHVESGSIRVAVLAGSGGSFINDAAAAGANVFVTGDLGHHQMVQALDRGIVAIDVGHATSEQPGVKALLDHVGKMHPNVIDLSLDPTPWRTV